MDECRIVSSKLLNRYFKDLCDQANSEGRGTSVVDAAEAIMKKLAADPSRRAKCSTT